MLTFFRVVLPLLRLFGALNDGFMPIGCCIPLNSLIPTFYVTSDA